MTTRRQQILSEQMRAALVDTYAGNCGVNVPRKYASFKTYKALVSRGMMTEAAPVLPQLCDGFRLFKLTERGKQVAQQLRTQQR